MNHLSPPSPRRNRSVEKACVPSQPLRCWFGLYGLKRPRGAIEGSVGCNSAIETESPLERIGVMSYCAQTV